MKIQLPIQLIDWLIDEKTQILTSHQGDVHFERSVRKAAKQNRTDLCVFGIIF